MASITNNVETMCKTMRKSLRLFKVKLCVNLKTISPTCLKKSFSTTFSHFLHKLINNKIFPVSYQSFPLFHQYYNYYDLNKLIIIK